MILRTLFAIFTCALIAPIAVAPGYGAPKPSPTPRRIVVRVHLPPIPLHTEFLVEVNKLGQIVRVRSGKSTKDLMFNAQTYGNVLQMWIRKPDGTGEVGLYRVTYDYNPKTRKVRRGVTLVQTGGTWGDKEGAVNQMLAQDRKSAAKQGLLLPKGSPQPANLPALNTIVGSPVPHGSSRP